MKREKHPKCFLWCNPSKSKTQKMYDFTNTLLFGMWLTRERWKSANTTKLMREHIHVCVPVTYVFAYTHLQKCAYRQTTIKQQYTCVCIICHTNCICNHTYAKIVQTQKQPNLCEIPYTCVIKHTTNIKSWV